MAASRVVNPVTGQKGRCYNRHQSYLKSDHNDEPQIIDFDDVPLWITAYYNGRLWMVAEKSEGISHIEGRHMLLGAIDNRQPTTAIIHETWVDYFLRNRSDIHFNWWDENRP